MGYCPLPGYRQCIDQNDPSSKYEPIGKMDDIYVG